MFEVTVQTQNKSGKPNNLLDKTGQDIGMNKYFIHIFFFKLWVKEAKEWINV